VGLLGMTPTKTCSTSGSVGEDFDAEAAGARAVEFAEENSLPAAEFEFFTFNENCGGGAYERSLDVRIGVAFGVNDVLTCRSSWLRAR